MTHTAEPWYIVESIGAPEIVADKGKVLPNGNHWPPTRVALALLDMGSEGMGEATRNAERIVACVNALAGVEDPEGLSFNPEAVAQLVEAAEDALPHLPHPAQNNNRYECDPTACPAHLLQTALAAVKQ